MFKVINKETKTTSLTPLLNIFQNFSNASIVDFE